MSKKSNNIKKTTMGFEHIDEYLFELGYSQPRTFVELTSTQEFRNQYGVKFDFYVDDSTFQPYLNYEFVDDECRTWFELKYSTMDEFIYFLIDEVLTAA